MNTRTLIENWLSQSSLAAGGLRALDADGFWAVPYGSITLTLAVPEEEAFFVLYAPLMSVSGGGAQVLSALAHLAAGGRSAHGHGLWHGL